MKPSSSSSSVQPMKGACKGRSFSKGAGPQLESFSKGKGKGKGTSLCDTEAGSMRRGGKGFWQRSHQGQHSHRVVASDGLSFPLGEQTSNVPELVHPVRGIQKVPPEGLLRSPEVFGPAFPSAEILDSKEGVSEWRRPAVLGPNREDPRALIKAAVSDHLPQIFWVCDKKVPVLSWNIMTRCRFNSLSGSTNNGFYKAEEQGQYERRLEVVARVVRAFFERHSSAAVVALQEFPISSELEERFMKTVTGSRESSGAGAAELHLARKSKFIAGDLSSGVGLANCFIWNSDFWTTVEDGVDVLNRVVSLKFIREKGAKGGLGEENWSLRLSNVHWRFKASRGMQGYEGHLRDLKEGVQFLLSAGREEDCAEQGRINESTFSAVVGDFNVDVRDLGGLLAPLGVSYQLVTNSSYANGKLQTNDACIERIGGVGR